MPQLNTELSTKVETAVNPNGLIDEGVYLVRLDGPVEAKPSQASGNTTWAWPFIIEPGQPFAGRKVTHRTTLTDNMFWKLKETFDAFGVPTSTDTDELTGKVVRVKLIVKDDYQGRLDDDGLVRQNTDVKSVLPANGPTGVDEAAKLRREKLREEALKALQESAAEAGAEGANGDGLF